LGPKRVCTSGAAMRVDACIKALMGLSFKSQISGGGSFRFILQ
jgi:hypothetical protein